MSEKLKTKSNIDFTQGNIWRQLILFSLPLLGGSLIQQMYNTVDLMFVGNILGKEASAAVGAGSLFLTCILGFFNGIGVGVGILAAKFYGAKNKVKLEETIQTAAGISIVCGIALIILCILVTPQILTLFKTPDDIMGLAITYLRVYFLSLLSIVSYNMSAGILRALGDSKTPVIYQLVGGFANIIGNILFIVVLKLGVAGAAMTTIFSQSMAAFLTVRRLCNLDSEYRLNLRKIRIVFDVLPEILKVGIPSAVQSMIITFSNIIVQSNINSLGVDSIAAYTAYFKVENFIYLPIMAIGQAATTFTGQNTGAGKANRVKKGMTAAMCIGVAVTVSMTVIMLIFLKPAFRLFTNDNDVINLGCQIARITFPFYFIYVFHEIMSGVMRGKGRTFVPMVIIVINMCLVRVMVINIAMMINPTAQGVAVIYPVTWITTTLSFAAVYYLKR